ncbi:MAG TPA: hypothetical protein VKB57_00165 [Acidimicrobiales bacterium]|nr:hypothetical protein [Acidimicrobiales bacterium]
MCRRRPSRSTPGATLLVLVAAAAVATGSLMGMPTPSSGATPPPVTVSATADPPSGGSVAPGATVTYTLEAGSQQPPPQGATVVDDLSGLLDHATVVTPPTELARRGLALDKKAERLTWTPAGLGGPDTPSATATASFEVAVAADAAGGAELTTAAFPEGESCAAGDPCATSLTVAGDPPATPTTATPTTATPTTATPTTATPTTAPTGPPPTTPPQAPSSTRAASATPSATPARAPRVPLAVVSPSADPVADCTQPQVPPADRTLLGGFEIDGNLCANTDNFDWSNVGGQPVRSDGFGDNTQWTGGAGENGWPWTASQTAGSGTSASNGDIGNLYAFTHVVDDHVFAYIAWQRAAVTGTAGFFVELNQKPNRFGPVPDRTSGDLRLLFVKAGSADLTFGSASTWRATSADSGSWVPLPDLAGFAGAVNPPGVTDLSGAPLPQGAFVEVGLDLTALFPAGDCSGNFGTVNLRSASSLNASSPPLQDWVAPIDMGIPSTCASVLVDKNWEIDGTPFANGSQPPGFSAALALTGRTDPQFGVTYDRRSDGSFYLAGDSVTIGETVTVPPGCATTTTGDSGAQDLHPGLNTFVVTNVVTCTRLTLRKVVVGGTAPPVAWILTATGPTPGITGPTGAAAVTGVRVVPGTYTLSETGPDDHQLSVTCTGATVSGTTVTVPAQADVTCTFTNTATHPIVLTKLWRDAVPGDTVDLTIGAGGATGTGSSTAPATTSDATLTAAAGDTVTLGEAFTTGTAANYASTLACDRGVTPSPATGTGGSFTVPENLEVGTPITCTFTNARRRAVVIMDKQWVDGAPGDTTTLSITGTDPATAASPSSTEVSTSLGEVGPVRDLRHRAAAFIFAGETVTLTEVLGSTNTGTYTSSFVCNNGASGAGTIGSFTAPAEPTDVICTVINTRTRATLTLQKTWVNGVGGDQAGLTIVGSDRGTRGAATSTATGAAGSETDTDNTATATIFSGGIVTMHEQLPPAGQTNVGDYTSEITCEPSTNFTPGAGGQGGTLVVPRGDTVADVNCTVTNTLAATAQLTLQKTWDHGAPGDEADLSATGGQQDGTATAQVPGGGIGGSADRVVVPIAPGDSVDLAEVLNPDNTGSYTSAIACDQPGLTAGTDGRSGTFLVPDEAESVVCTITNTRTSATLTLQKTWVDGADGDQAGLSVAGTDPSTAGEAISTATGAAGSETDGDNQVTTTIFSGGTVTLREGLDPTNTGTYTAALDCDNDTTATGTTGSFTVPDEPVDVVCTFSNTRTSATLTLQKTWVNGAGGDTTGLSITGSEPGTAGDATSTATGAAGSETDTDNQATATIFSGGTVTVDEALDPGNTGTYTSALACDNDTTVDGTTGSFDVPDEPTDVLCTFTNTRTQATLTLHKAWVNGAPGDQAGLSITGTDPATSGSAIAMVPDGSGVSSQQASATVFSGQTVTVSEDLPPEGHTNVGTYTSGVVCSDRTTADGTSTTVTIPDDPVNLTCTFLNGRNRATVVLTKSWVNAIAGDQVQLGVTDGTRSGVGTSIAPNTNFDASLDVFAGDTVTLAESFIAGTAANYEDASLACDNGVTVTGDSFVVPGVPATPITCTFTNTRRQATLTLHKAWVNGAAGDQAGLSVIGTDGGTSGSATATVPAGGTGTSTEAATATIFAGGTVTVNEELPPAGHDNVGAYTSETACTPSAGFTPGEGGQGGTLVVPSTPVEVSCTITNTRSATGELTLEKHWINGFPGDSADLTVAATLETATTTALVPGQGTGTSPDKVVVPIASGESLDLGEVLPAAGHTNVGAYVSSLACDQPGLTADANGRGGTFAVSADQAAVRCTFTNTASPPAPAVTKTVTSNVQNPDGTWTIVYDVAVTNPDPSRPTAFTLVDALAFGAGIRVNSASVTGAGADPDWDGSTTATVVSEATLDPLAAEHYTVTVNATVLPGATTADRSCAAGGGFLNTAGVSLPAAIVPAALQASACADPVSPTVRKRVVSVVAGSAPDRWVVTYAVTATNGTGTDLTYSLRDRLGFPAGVTITSTAASRVHSAQDGSGATAPEPVAGWTGSGSGTVLATGRSLVAHSRDSYTLIVGATVTSGVADSALACSTAGRGHGWFNSATLTSGADRFSAAACAPIVRTPLPPPVRPPVLRPQAPGAAGTLPFTGLILVHGLVAAAVLLCVGTALLLARRRVSYR